jgi:catechol 2,3-dioxygenase-like lactoylglutathione lyase family enzyme
MLKSLDYLYVPATDIEAGVRFYVEQLGGELVWKIHAYGAWVAGIRLSTTGPMVLLASHLKGKAPLPIYQVDNLERMTHALKASGWEIDRILEIPNGPCCVFRDPNQIELAIYENIRPEVDSKFAGQIDS